jgi:hypothetical protein
MTIRKLLLLLSIPLNTRAQTQPGHIKTDAVLNAQVITITGATPRVVNGNVFKTGNSGLTTITNFLGTGNPQRVTIICGDRKTSIGNSANVATATGSTLTCSSMNLAFDFEYYPSQPKWVQISGRSPGGIQANQVNTFTAQQNLDADRIYRDPNPFVDVRDFGVRAVNPNVIPNTTCTINSGSRLAACASAAGFAKGDGIDILGGGAAQSMITPAAPTVTPICAAGPLGLGFAVASGSGSASYQYQIAMRDKGQGLTAASTAGTTSHGNATLGAKSTALFSTSSGIANTFTSTVASSADLAPGCMIILKGSTDDAEFGGWKIVVSVPDSTHITWVSGINAAYGISTNRATGGKVFYFLGNQIMLPTPGRGGTQYEIFGRTAGSMTGIGWSTIANLGYTDSTYNKWEDYGPTMMAGLVLPWWAPTTPPVSATPDSLITRITNISGTTLTLANHASNKATSTAARFDNSPGIVAAVAASNSNSITGAGGTIRFPVVVEESVTGNYCYVTSSYLVVSASAVNQDGAVCLGDTLQLTTAWNGTNNSAARLLAPSFALGGRIPINLNGANPGIYIKTGGGLSNVLVNLSGNGGIGVFNAGNGNSPGQIFENDIFTSNGNATNDYMSIPFYDYQSSVSGGFGGKIRNSSFLVGSNLGGGQAQVGQTAAPAFVTKFNTLWDMDYISCSVRGFVFVAHISGLSGKFHLGEECQGPIMPIVSFMGASTGNTSGFFVLENFLNDTGPAPLVANLSPTNMTLGASLSIIASNLPSSNQPLISGSPFGNVFIFGLNATQSSQYGQNTNMCVVGGANGFNPGITCTNYALASMLSSRQNPTISSGFGTSPSIVTNNGSAVIKLNVGTGATATSGVIGMPAAANGWSCNASDVTNPGPNFTKQSADTTTSVTLTNYNSSGTPTAWSANDILRINCSAY